MRAFYELNDDDDSTLQDLEVYFIMNTINNSFIYVIQIMKIFFIIKKLKNFIEQK